MNQQIICKNLLISYTNFNPQASQSSVIFLHGWRSNKEIWQSVIGKLSGQNIYAIDLPGFGGSQVPPRPFTVGDYADVVAEFISKLGIHDAAIVGHSFGGRVGIKLAALHPQIIGKLVLVDSAGFAMDPNKKSLMNAGAKIAKPFFKPKFMQGLRKKIYQSIGAEDYIATPELQRTFVNIVSEDLTEDMRKITCPTLIITGENDQETPIEFGQRMHVLISAKGGSASGGHNSKFIILPNAGHFSFLDKPDEFVQNLNQFLQHG